VVTAAAASALVAGCGGTAGRPLTIGILADCRGPYASLYEPSIAAAELPFLERGAARAGKAPSAGIEHARVGGRRVRLAFGCTDLSAETTLNEARRLVDGEGAAILVGGLVPAEGLALRAFAARRSNVTFVITPSTPQSITLRNPLPNVFRFAPDSAQVVAGLGTYAYRTLGWRTAVVLGERSAYDFGEAAGFAADFCSLGGKVVRRLWAGPGTPAATLAAAARSPHADGAAIFAISLGTDLVRAFAPTGPLRSRVVTDVVLAGALPSAFGARAEGVVWAWPDATPNTTVAAGQYRDALRRAFPGQPDATATFPAEYYTAVEAVARALASARGESGTSFRRALARTDFDGPLGRVRLDRHRQLVATTQIAAVGSAGPRRLRTVAGIDEAFGGIFRTSSPPPGPDEPPCAKANPPRWAFSQATT
jgi:branched-chain amino acid transport system substrate-binding protein